MTLATRARRGGNLRNRGADAFTVVELLVVLAVIAVLVVLQLPALARAKGQTRLAQCADNLRRFTLATEISADESSGDKLPQVSSGSAFWAWDMPWSTATLLLNYGSQREFMYCPGFPEQNNDILWNWVPNSLRVIGYAMTFPGTASVIATNQNPSIVPQTITLAGVVYAAPSPSGRALLADATISEPGQNQTDSVIRASYQYSGIPGGYTAPGWTGHRSGHLLGNVPGGGNVGMLDGHVEWRQFSSMIPRTSGGSPTFWW